MLKVGPPVEVEVEGGELSNVGKGAGIGGHLVRREKKKKSLLVFDGV